MTSVRPYEPWRMRRFDSRRACSPGGRCHGVVPTWDVDTGRRVLAAIVTVGIGAALVAPSVAATPGTAESWSTLGVVRPLLVQPSGWEVQSRLSPVAKPMGGARRRAWRSPRVADRQFSSRTAPWEKCSRTLTWRFRVCQGTQEWSPHATTSRWIRAIRRPFTPALKRAKADLSHPCTTWHS